VKKKARLLLAIGMLLAMVWDPCGTIERSQHIRNMNATANAGSPTLTIPTPER
jgi:hypothetical protein